jgi:hypothetical protein
MLPWIKMNLKIIGIINPKRRMATKGDAPRRVRSPTVREGLIGYLAPLLVGLLTPLFLLAD